MKLGCVLTACDLNPQYIAFVPVWLKAWKRTHPGVEAKVILVGDEVPRELEAHSGHLILHPPIEGVSTALLAQCIRLLYPALLDCDGAVLITDVDMLPLNGTYYAGCLKGQPDGKFVNLSANAAWARGRRPRAKHMHARLPMMYNAALPAIWGEVFSVASVEDVDMRLREIASSAPNAVGTLRHKAYHAVVGLGPMGILSYMRWAWKNGPDLSAKAAMLRRRLRSGMRQYRMSFSRYYWFADEMYLYRRAMAWDRRTGNLALLNPAEHGRRRMPGKFDHVAPVNFTPELKRNVRAGLYSEWHCPRPYSVYGDDIEAMVELL